jgi:hypothetical protein
MIDWMEYAYVENRSLTASKIVEVYCLLLLLVLELCIRPRILISIRPFLYILLLLITTASSLHCIVINTSSPAPRSFPT